MCSTFDAAASDFEIVEMRSNIPKEKLIEQKGIHSYLQSVDCSLVILSLFAKKKKIVKYNFKATLSIKMGCKYFPCSG